MAQINWIEFNELYKHYDKDFTAEIIKIFIDEYDERISTLQKNIDEKDLENVVANAHKLKGLFGNFYARYGVILLQCIEDMAKINQDKLIPIIFEEAKPVSKELLDELVEYLKTSHLR